MKAGAEDEVGAHVGDGLMDFDRKGVGSHAEGGHRDLKGCADSNGEDIRGCFGDRGHGSVGQVHPAHFLSIEIEDRAVIQDGGEEQRGIGGWRWDVSSHFIDLLGAEYELGGRNRRWWTPDDLAKHEVAYTPLVKQISAYRPVPDVAVNATQTLTENIADLGGLAAAFDAYRLTLGSRVSDTAYVRAQDRQFFIAFARSWRSLYNDEALRAQLATDTHAPDRYRIATVRNLDAWYEAFDVRPGQKLYLEPSARVRVW